MNRRRFLAGLSVLATPKWQEFALNPSEADLAPPRFPYVQYLQNDRATVIWTTLENGSGVVRWTPDGVNYRTAAAISRIFPAAETGLSVTYTQYQANLTSLTPGTEYSYDVSVNNVRVAPGGDLRFRTAGPGPFDFFVLGDSGLGSKDQSLIARQMQRENPALVIHTGDLAYPQGTHAFYQTNYFNYYSATMGSVPFFPTPGNHDYEVRNAAVYMAIHSVPTQTVPVADRGRYYSYDWGNVHFVSLDSNVSLENAVNSGGPMLKWLDNDLRSTRQFWRVVYFHHPPYAMGPNRNDIHSLWIRQYVVPILEAHGVQIVFSGHEHSYQRSECIRNSTIAAPDTGTNYFVSGGGGSFLYPVFDGPLVAMGKSAHHYLRGEVRETRMTIHAIGSDGIEFDSLTLSPQPAFSDDSRTQPISFIPAPIAGSLIRIAGRALAAEEAVVCTPIPPIAMSGTTVTINGVPISLLFVSSNQIYGQLPFTPEGNITVRVTTPNGFVEASVNPG